MTSTDAVTFLIIRPVSQNIKGPCTSLMGSGHLPNWLKVKYVVPLGLLNKSSPGYKVK